MPDLMTPKRWPILPGDIPEPTGEVSGEDYRMRLKIAEWWKSMKTDRLPNN